MKKKAVEAAAPVYLSGKNSGKEGYINTVQQCECGEILVLNLFKDGILKGRHAISTETGEYAQYNAEKKYWTKQRYATLMDYDVSPYGYYSVYEARKEMRFDTEEQRQQAENALCRLNERTGTFPGYEIWDMIEEAEQAYNRTVREKTENNRVDRIKALMARIPDISGDIREWMAGQENAGACLIYDKQEGKGCCTCCGGIFGKESFGTKKIRNGSALSCPGCGERVQTKTRIKSIRKKGAYYLLQKAGGDMTVLRCMDTLTEWTAAGRKVSVNESARVILYPGKEGRVYYNQYHKSLLYGNEREKRELHYFDDRHNAGQRRIWEGQLYPEGVREALEGIIPEAGSRAVSCLASAQIKCPYTGVIAACAGTEGYAAVVEYLYKGKFGRLLQETLDNVYSITGKYVGDLNLSGTSIETVFGLKDRQNINRIRQQDGGERMLYWIRKTERKGEHIPDKVLSWLCENEIKNRHTALVEKYMSFTQIMNYISRQQASGYQGKTAPEVFEQWNDYLLMLEKLGRKADTEMMYRPGDLRRRHDECVARINQIRMLEAIKHSRERDEEEARRMRERFPGAEEILKEIRPKYEYESEEYCIRVPGNLMEIIQDSTALHHCAGATDRYFDRIMQRETYICFLRKKENPDMPYYTLEVEPGGTIRQHRGYCDEEPEIEQIKPFLKKWQQHIKRSLSEKERALAETSRQKRERNILELQEQKKRQVLQGLMEDLMEA